MLLLSAILRVCASPARAEESEGRASEDARAAWTAPRFERVSVPGGWEVRAGSQRVSAVEFAAITGDQEVLDAFERRERGAHTAAFSLAGIGGVLAGLTVVELVEWRTTKVVDPGLAEDHLWRGAVLALSAALPIGFCAVPMRRERSLRADVSSTYDAAQVDARLLALNRDLTASDGAPEVTAPPSEAAP